MWICNLFYYKPNILFRLLYILLQVIFVFNANFLIRIVISGPPNPFNNSPWPQPAVCPPNPFQAVPPSVAVGISKPNVSQQTSNLPSGKPSLPNGNPPFWPSAANQSWSNQFQNGFSDAFQNKAPVADCNPWSQSFGTSGANPFMVNTTRKYPSWYSKTSKLWPVVRLIIWSSFGGSIL